MERERLYELWQRNKDRPQFVREYREHFVEHLSDTVVASLPSPGDSTFAYRQFLNDYKGTVTRQLNDDSDGGDPHDDADGGDSTNTEADEGGA